MCIYLYFGYDQHIGVKNGIGCIGEAALQSNVQIWLMYKSYKINLQEVQKRPPLVQYMYVQSKQNYNCIFYSIYINYQAQSGRFKKRSKMLMQDREEGFLVYTCCHCVHNPHMRPALCRFYTDILLIVVKLSFTYRRIILSHIFQHVCYYVQHIFLQGFSYLMLNIQRQTSNKIVNNSDKKKKGHQWSRAQRARVQCQRT